MREIVLVGDVGGTNTRLGLLADNTVIPTRVMTYRNSDYSSLYNVISHYLQKTDEYSCGQICLALAAPIVDQTVALTNCDWVIDAQKLRQTTGAKTVRLINDLEALAWSLDRLPTSSIAPVATGKTQRNPMGGRLVIGAGTGFNAASLISAPQTGVLSAECGHMTLPVQTDQDLRLRDHLAQGRGRASVERALSGQGLCEVYQWAAAQAGQRSENLTAGQITDRALHGSDAACVHAAETVLRLLATVAGDLALAYLPHGGTFLAGSVCRALMPMMAQGGFVKAFCAKGRQTDLMQSFSIDLITDDAAALIGCAALARRQMNFIAELTE